AVRGRRACEVEWDLLELLDPPPAASEPPAVASPLAQSTSPAQSAPPAPPAPRLHDRPSALELLDAARATLGDEVLSKLEGRSAFQLRVSMRALGIVKRELEHSDEDRDLHAAVLVGLGVSDEAGLAGAIRTGAFDA